MLDKITVGIVQTSPVFVNLEASFAKAINLIEQAANKGAKLFTTNRSWNNYEGGFPTYMFQKNSSMEMKQAVTDKRGFRMSDLKVKAELGALK